MPILTLKLIFIIESHISKEIGSDGNTATKTVGFASLI